MCFVGVNKLASLFPGDNTVSVTPTIGIAPDGAAVRVTHIDQETGICTLQVEGGQTMTARIVSQRRGDGSVTRIFEILTA